ncbi:MAG TPA: hypothetical protein DCM45_06470 [Clostridiales bacterium]|nr:hypothetical protein [Clostridiales bacterium]
MKQIRKIMLVFVILAIVLSSFVACTNTEPTVTTGTTGTQGTTATPTTTLPPEPTEIQFFIYDMRGVGANAKAITDKVNEITKASINVTAEFSWLGAADYVTQLGLVFSSNEAYDLCTIMPREGANFTTLSANGQLYDITEILAEYGPEMKELVGKYIDAYTVNGKVLGVPTYRNYSSSVYVIMRKDILEQIGMLDKAKNMTTFTGLEEILEAVKTKTNLSGLCGTKNISYMAGIVNGSDKFAESTLFDTLSDVLNVSFVDDSGKISLLPENAAFKYQMDMVRRWYNKGYIYQDSMVTEDHPDTLIKAGVSFAEIQTSEIGVETAKSSATGFPMTAVEIAKNLLASGFVNKFGTGVPITADEPEAAVMWLQELYTNPVLENLMVWGIEGEDYVVTDGVAEYPAGVDPKNVKFHSVDFVYGNYFNALPWKGTSKDFRQVAMQTLKAAPISKYLGFSPNMKDLTNLIAALTAVNDQHRAKIYVGAYTDADYAAYIAALKAAGVEQYLAALQTQLDAWVAANK